MTSLREKAVRNFTHSKIEKNHSANQSMTVNANGICNNVQSVAFLCFLLKCWPRNRNGMPASSAAKMGLSAPQKPTPSVISFQICFRTVNIPGLDLVGKSFKTI